MLRVVLSLVLVVAALGCGESSNQKGSETPNAVASPDPPSTPPTSASAEPPAEPEPPRKHRPYEIHNSCNDVVIVVFGEDPKGPAKKTIAPGATIEGVRNNDGNMALLLVTDKDEQLVRVNITRGMKRVEVGKSCRTLDAR